MRVNSNAVREIQAVVVRHSEQQFVFLHVQKAADYT